MWVVGWSSAEARGKDELGPGARGGRWSGAGPYEKVVACLVAQSSIHQTPASPAGAPDARPLTFGVVFIFIFNFIRS